MIVPNFGSICFDCLDTSRDVKIERSFYSKRRAIGNPDIKTDCIVFHYRKDIYNLPTVRMRGVATYNRKWCFYTAPIKKLKEVADKVIR